MFCFIEEGECTAKVMHVVTAKHRVYPSCTIYMHTHTAVLSQVILYGTMPDNIFMHGRKFVLKLTIVYSNGFIVSSSPKAAKWHCIDVFDYEKWYHIVQASNIVLQTL